MNITIYNNSSFGGCYEYGKRLLAAYNAQTTVQRCTLLLPQNAACNDDDCLKILLTDLPSTTATWRKKLHFIYRTFINPLILFRYLMGQPPNLVIFNDFDQLSALFWAPLFRLFLRKKHRFAIILHDPDRDAYPPGLWLTIPSMKAIMRLMHMALYHEYLPEKVYYKGKKSNTVYLSIPHGLYEVATADAELKADLLAKKLPESKLFTIIGNIRAEKNYHMAIRALRKFKHMQLLIAGQAANSQIDIDAYKHLAQEFGVAHRIIWVEKYLSASEMAAVIEASDVLLLYYSTSFTSQSGVLNTIAPFQKPIIVSDAASSLAVITKKFGLGILAQADSQLDFEKAIAESFDASTGNPEGWREYIRYASWEHHVQIVLEALNNIG